MRFDDPSNPLAKTGIHNGPEGTWRRGVDLLLHYVFQGDVFPAVYTSERTFLRANLAQGAANS